MISLTAPMVNKLNQLIAGGGGGGEGGSVDLTPVLSAVAAVSSKADALQLAVEAIEAPAGGGGGETDLTPVLSAVAAVSSKADALQAAVDAIEIPSGDGGSSGSVIKSIQRMTISLSIAAGTTVDFPISPINAAKAVISTIATNNFISSVVNVAISNNNISVVNTAASTSFSPVLKIEVIEYV